MMRKRSIALTILSLLSFFSVAVAQEKEKVYPLEQITVTATRSEREIFDTPRAITIVDKKALEEKNQLSIVDSLNDKIGIWVEKRTTTTSDPVMRGLSGSNILALIDGNTLSTLWGEGGFAGDDMYGKVDPDSIERIEVVRGPSSVLYGSNALGGVINFITRSCPLDFTERGFNYGFRIKPTLGSAADEWRLRGEIFAATPWFRFIWGGSKRDVNDVRGGRGVGVQRPTSGQEGNWDFKGEFRLTTKQTLSLTIQDIRRTQVHRFYRPTQDNYNDRKAIAVFYTAQEPTDFWDQLEGNFYYQYKRDTRRFFDRQVKGEAITRTYSGELKMISLWGESHRFTYGFHYERDNGESPDDEQFTFLYPTGKKKDSPDSIWQNYGFYLQDEWDLTSRLTLILSGRYDRFIFESEIDSHYQPPGGWDPTRDEFTDRLGEFTGGISVLYRLKPNINLVANYFRGFRQWPPKFGATQHGYGIVVPTKLLDPVTGDTYELGIKIKGKKFQGSLFNYYSYFHDFQVIVPGTFQGQDWYDFNKNGIRDATEGVYEIKSGGEAYVYGVELEGRLWLNALYPALSPYWSLKGGFMWNYGKNRWNGQPLRHTAPVRGILTLRYDNPDWKWQPWFELSADIVRHYDRIPADRIKNDPGYRKDPQDMQSPLLRSYGGLPGFTIFTFRGGARINKNIRLTLSIENLTDKKYRRAHSRWDEPGINVVGGINITF